jgi:hypothetical protein
MRQREMRRADFHRTTLLELREALGEVDDTLLRVFLARQEALERTGSWDTLAPHHPDLEGAVRVKSRLLVLAAGLENLEAKELFGQVASISYSVLLVARAQTADEAEQHRTQLNDLKTRVLLSIGRQLSRLP